MWQCNKLLRVVVIALVCAYGTAQGPQQQQESGILLSGLSGQGRQDSGVPLTSTSAQHPSFGLGSPGAQPQSPIPVQPVVVPLDQENIGVPLPPYTVEDAGAESRGPGGLGGPGGLHGVRNPQQDHDVQRLVKLPDLQQHLQASTRADTAIKIVDVITAHKQVVAGQLVYLTLSVGETYCPRGTQDLTTCQVDPTEDTHICEVVFWERPWLNSTKIVGEKSKCADTEDDADFKNYRHLTLPVASPSEVALDRLPANVEEQQVVAEAFNYIEHSSDSKFRGRLVNFDLNNIRFDPATNTTRAQVEVEYGFTLCLKSHEGAVDPRPCLPDIARSNYVCSVIVIHSPNHLTALEVIPILDDINDIHCEKKIAKAPVQEELVVAVEAPCTGCPRPVPLTDPMVLDLADFALTEYDRTSSDDELHSVVRLIKAHSQVTSGVKYFLTVEVVDTDCKKRVTGVDVNRTFCNPDPTDSSDVCDFHVIEQPWVPARDLVLARCQDKDDYYASSHDEFIVPVSHAGSNLGAALGATPSRAGKPPVNVDEATSEIVQAVVATYNQHEDDSEYYKLVKVHEATSQVDASGMKVYKVAVELGETRCNKNDPTIGNGDNCPLDPTEEHEVCEAEVHVLSSPQPSRRIVSLSCDDLDDYQRKKLLATVNSFTEANHPFLDTEQDALAGYQTVATNDPGVQALASFVVDQYNLHEDDDELYAMTEVVSAFSQSTSEGTRYHLELQLAETYCKKYLVVSDPSRCHINYLEDREMCQAEAFVPQAPGATPQLSRLFCDEINDYYVRRIRGKLGRRPAFNQQPRGPGLVGGNWINVNTTDPSLKKLGQRLADEYDIRSDDDNLFVFFKVLQARKQVSQGLRYHLTVELQETVCPKYKRRIHKSRCIPDIGEEHVICEASILMQPWLNKQDVSDLRCAEKDDFFEGDDSVEILYPRVHPSAHARPKFKSQFMIRSSDESEESNERFYHSSGRKNLKYDTDEDDDDDDSDEIIRIRGRRTIPGGSSPVELPDEYIDELAQFALTSSDELSEDPRVRIVEKVISAKKKIVAGVQWTVEMSVIWTNCLKTEQSVNLSTCEKDANELPRHCTVVIYERPWMSYRKVTEMTCKPVEE